MWLGQIMACCCGERLSHPKLQVDVPKLFVSSSQTKLKDACLPNSKQAHVLAHFQRLERPSCPDSKCSGNSPPCIDNGYFCLKGPPAVCVWWP